MKKFLALALSIIALAAFAEQAKFRVDVFGQSSRIELPVEASDDFSVAHAAWLGKYQQYTLTAVAKKRANSDEWTLLVLSFTPSKSGTLNVCMRGDWAKEKANRAWSLVDSISLNDALVANGDFKENTIDPESGLAIPKGFKLDKNAKLLPNAGDNGSAALLVNHDNPANFSLKVKDGVNYRLVFKVKAATAEQLK